MTSSWPIWNRNTTPADLSRYVTRVVLVPRLPPHLGVKVPGPGSGNRLDTLRDLYDVFQAARITYSDEPATADEGQRIRSADEILATHRQSNCLDLCLLFAGAALDAGLHPAVVVLDEGATSHAIVVVWLEDRWPHAAHAYPFSDELWPQPPTDQDGFTLLSDLRSTTDSPGAFCAIDVASVTGEATFDEAVGAAYEMISERTWAFGVDVGLAHLRGLELFQPPTGPTSKPVLDPPYYDGKPGSPLAQVRARSTSVGFYPTTDLEWLLEWARDPSMSKTEGDLRVALITGPGGAGKTRLAAELCDRLAADGWFTGFLPRKSTKEDRLWLTRLPSRQVIVIDYPEALSTDDLAQILEDLSSATSPSILVFTARESGKWWDDAVKAIGDARIPAAVNAPYAVTLQRSINNQKRLFDSAVHTLGNGSPATVRFTEDSRWTTLDIILQAWLAASGDPNLPRNRDVLYREVLSQEFAYWLDALASRGITEDEDRLAQLGAAITLLGPTDAEQIALVRRAVLREPTPFDAPLPPAEYLLYAKAILDLLGGGDHHAVRPDPIGEYLLLKYPLRGGKTLPEDVELWQEYLEPDAGRPLWGQTPRVANALEVVTRAWRSEPVVTTQWAIAILAELPDLWLPALDLSMRMNGPFVRALESAASDNAIGLPLAAIASAIPHGHSWLRELASLCAERSLPTRPADDENENLWPYAHSLISLATRLFETGDRAGALTAASEAVTLHRRLAEADPEFVPSLATSLNNLATFMGENGDRVGALTTATEAVAIYRPLVATNPTKFTPKLAMCLSTLAGQQAETGDLSGALVTAKEAVSLYRESVTLEPAELPNLATALNNLANGQWLSRDFSGAVNSSAEALGLYRQLASAEPARFTPNLAMVLANTSVFQTASGDTIGAVTTATESTALYRQLAANNPGAFNPNLAASLNALAISMYRIRKFPEALTSARDAVALYSHLATGNPAAFTSDLTAAMNNLSLFQSIAGDRDAALTSAAEAVDLERGLAASDDPVLVTTDLAESLDRLSARLSETGDRDGALRAANEATAMYRQLATDNPAVVAPNLAQSLQALSARLSETGDRDGALRAANEATEMYRQLAEGNPVVFAPHLAASLIDLSGRLFETGSPSLSLATAVAATEMYREIASLDPATFTPNLAASLTNLGAILSATGDPVGAVSRAREGTELYRALANANPASYNPQLASSLNNLGALLSATGDRDGALMAAAEATKVFRGLARAYPDAFNQNLAMSLNNLAKNLSESGDRLGALRAAVEATDLYRALARANPDAHEPNLAMCLNNLANGLSETGDWVGAVTIASEATALYGSLARAKPDVFNQGLALSLITLARSSYWNGDLPEALNAASEAVDLYRQLVLSTPAAFDPNLALALSTLAASQHQAGDLSGALKSATESVALYRRLVVNNPAVITPNLASSISNLAVYLSETGDRSEALAAFSQAIDEVPRTTAARLWIERARWRRMNPVSSPAVEDDCADDLRQALAITEAMTDPRWIGPLRRAIRSEVQSNDDHGELSKVMPRWATAPLSEALTLNLLQSWSSGTWAERMTILRDQFEVWTQATQEIEVTIDLYPETTEAQEILGVLQAIAEHGLEPVIESILAQDTHQRLVNEWLQTDTWTASANFARRHPQIFEDPLTMEVLRSTGNNEMIQQHFAIVLLAQHQGIDRTYEAILDPWIGSDHAMQLLDKGDLNTLTLLLQASPEIAEQTFRGPLALATIFAANNQPDPARELITIAATQATDQQRTLGARRLRALTNDNPNITALFQELADTLLNPPEPPATPPPV